MAGINTMVKLPDRSTLQPGRYAGTFYIFFFFFCLAVGSVGYLYLKHEQAEIRQTAVDQLAAVADLKASEIANWYMERMEDARIVRDTPWLGDSVMKLAADSSSLDVKSEVPVFLNSLQRNSHYNRILLFDRNARVLLAVPGSSSMAGERAISFVEKALRTNEIFVSDIHLSKMVPGTVDMDIFVPLLTRRGESAAAEVAGVIMFEVNPYFFLFPTIKVWPTASPTAESLLVREDDGDVVFLNELRHSNNSPLTLRIPVSSSTDLPAAMAVKGREGVVDGVDYRKVPVLAAMRHVSGTPWALVAKVDLDEIFLPHRRAAMATGLILFLLIVVIGLVLFVVLRRREDRLIREQFAVNKASEEKYRTVADYTHDWEYWRGVDGEYLYVSPSCERVTGYRAEAFIQDAGLIERIIHPDDQTMFCNHLEDAGERPDSSVIDFRIRTHDGSERWLSHVCQPVYSADGVYLGRRGSNRDVTDRKRSEGALRESETRFRSVVENSSAGYFFIDANGYFRDVNAAWLRMYGYSNIDEVAGVHFTVVQREPDVEQAKVFVAGIMKGDERCQSGEFSRKLRDGSTAYHTFSARPVVRDGKTIGVEGFIIDTTENRKAAEALRDSELKFRSLFDNMAEGVALHDLIRNEKGEPVDYRVIDVNPAYEKHTGLSPAKVKGAVGTYIYGVSEAPYLDVFAGVAESGVPYFFETYFEPMEKYFYISVVSPARGRFATVFEDITARKQAEASLAAEKERLLVTLRSIGDGVITTDVNGSVTLMNKVAEDLTGWRMAEAVTMPLSRVFNIINEVTGEQCENPVDKVLQSGGVIGLANHTALVARDGRIRVIADSGAPIRDKDSRIIGVVLVFRDISEQQKTELALRNADKLNSLGVLAGGIAHDFNNLLGGLFGYLDLARDLCESQEYEKVSYNLAKALSVFSRARDLTQQLLTFAKGGKPIKKIVALEPLVRQSAQFCMSGSDIKLVLRLPYDLWPCEVDENQMGQVIDNIVLNARQAMPTGGVVSISGTNVPDGSYLPIELERGNYVRISIEDCGGGIPRDHLSRIFDPFFTTKHLGSGLGLATVYSIMKNHGGLVAVSSELGKGSVFTLYLPAAKGQEVVPVPAMPAAVAGKGRVLVMDDEEPIREICSSMLKRVGYITECAANGDEAISMYRTAFESGRPYEFVILDLTIPDGKGGRETVVELKKIDASACVVASSGYSKDPIMANPGDYGFAERLIKPYRKDEMLQLLHALKAAKNV